MLTPIKGLVAMETLLESHVDKAMDKFTAWALRNTFDIPPEVEMALVSVDREHTLSSFSSVTS